MRTNIAYSEIVNEIYNIFSDDRQAAAYMADEWGRTAETQAINAALVVVPSNVMRNFRFIADSGELVTNPGRAALLHPSRGFVCMPDDEGTPYTPAGGADALAAILRAGGFLNFDEFRFVWPIEHDADTIRRVLAAYGMPEKLQNQDDPTDEIGHSVEYYNGVTWNPADLIGCKQAACILMRQGATWAELEPLDFGGLDLSAVWEEEHPDDKPTAPTDGTTGAAYGLAEKSPISEEVAVSVPDVKEYKLMYLFGGWVCHSRVYAETDAEAIHDATDDYISSTLPRWPYRVALWEGSRLVHVFKEDGPDDIGRRDMEQEESENAPAYIVRNTTEGPFHFDDCATGSILAAVDRVAKNEHTANPHPLQLFADGVKVWDREEHPTEYLAHIVRQRLAL